MKRRDVLAGLALTAAAAPALAQTAPTVRVRIETDKGGFTLELYPDKAPLTVGNFLQYVDGKRYNGSTIYRAMKAPGAPLFGVLQGGLFNGPGSPLKPVAHEPTTQTGLKHDDGVISMGRYQPGTASSEWFICLGPAGHLDARPDAPGDNAGFAAFGRVIEGMETVRAIHALPTHPTAGPEAMRGQILEPPVRMISARRL
jgi:peptidyl-prolyl cis-trans isomerase A (cyclophilin A)